MNCLRRLSIAPAYLLLLVLRLSQPGICLQHTMSAPVTVFGPVEVVRSTGKPVVQQFTFVRPLVVHDPFELIIQNGTVKGKDRTSSADIQLNGLTVAGPSSFNQNVVSIRIPVTLSENNRLSVSLRSKPGSRVALSLEGQIVNDQFLADNSTTVAFSGATLSLPNVAELDIPAGVFDVPTDVQFTALSSEVVDFLAMNDLQNFVPLQAPKIRIKTSQPARKPINLIVHGLDLSSVPADREIVFVAVRQTGESNEEGPLTLVTGIGGTPCEGGTAACVHILPEAFSAANPLDPLDPAITIALGTEPACNGNGSGTPHQLWRLSDVNLDMSDIAVSSSDALSLSGRFGLQKDFTFFPFTPLSFLQITGHFYRSGSGAYHGGIDLHAGTGTSVFAVLDGTSRPGFGVARQNPDPGFYCACPPGTCSGKFLVKGGLANQLVLDHSADFSTVYGHLLAYSPLVAPNRRVGAPSEIALSDGDPDVDNNGIVNNLNAGKSCAPHLHFGALFCTTRHIDPEPLLPSIDDLRLYVTDQKHPVKLDIEASINTPGTPQNMIRLIAAPETVTTIDFPFSQALSFASLQPGSSYKMYLKLMSDRLGGEYNLRTWNLKVGYRLRVSISGSGTGTISALPDINCGTQCTAIFDPNTAVTLIATANAGSTFVQWTGDCSFAATAATLVLQLSSDKSCTAIFAPIPPASTEPIVVATGIGDNVVSLQLKTNGTAVVGYLHGERPFTGPGENLDAILLNEIGSGSEKIDFVSPGTFQSLDRPVFRYSPQNQAGVVYSRCLSDFNGCDVQLRYHGQLMPNIADDILVDQHIPEEESIEFSNDGRPILLYFDFPAPDNISSVQLKRAQWNGHDWTRFTVDGRLLTPFASNISTAHTSKSDLTYVAYTAWLFDDAMDFTLSALSPDGTIASSRLIESGPKDGVTGIVGAVSDLTADGTGQIHLLYKNVRFSQDPTQDDIVELKYYNNMVIENIETAPNISDNISIAVDVLQHPIVVYIKDGILKLVRRASSHNWVPLNVLPITPNVIDVDIAIDTHNILHLVYVDKIDQTIKYLRTSLP